MWVFVAFASFTQQNNIQCLGTEEVRVESTDNPESDNKWYHTLF